MKIQLGFVEELESIFEGVFGDAEASRNSTDTIESIKEIFLKNVEMDGRELSLQEIEKRRRDQE